MCGSRLMRWGSIDRSQVNSLVWGVESRELKAIHATTSTNGVSDRSTRQHTRHATRPIVTAARNDNASGAARRRKIDRIARERLDSPCRRALHRAIIDSAHTDEHGSIYTQRLASGVRARTDVSKARESGSVDDGAIGEFARRRERATV
jgi:hypothetical protein